MKNQLLASLISLSFLSACVTASEKPVQSCQELVQDFVRSASGEIPQVQALEDGALVAMLINPSEKTVRALFVGTPAQMGIVTEQMTKKPTLKLEGTGTCKHPNGFVYSTVKFRDKIEIVDKSARN